jgi:glycosyltransferase involved in cell wall biosynthesis
VRITFVLPAFDLSGGVRVVATHAEGLRRRGHAVTVVSPGPRPPARTGLLKSFLGKAPQLSASHGASHLDGLAVERRVLEGWRPVQDGDLDDADVVVATWWETAEWVHALNERKGAKVYFIQHHEVFPYLPVARCHATYRLPMHKVVVASWLRDTMHRLYGDRQVDLVPNAVDATRFHATARRKQPSPTVGFLYSTTPFKGVGVLLSALRAVRARMPGVRLLAFGAEPPSPHLPLPPGTEFALRPAQREIRELYARCDAWLTASTSEGFNLPALEAMACRTPVIATRTGWPAEAIVSWRNGVLVDVGDAQAMARAALRLLALGDDEWLQLSENALRTASCLSWDHSVQKFERALQRACERAERGEIAGRSGLCASPS